MSVSRHIGKQHLIVKNPSNRASKIDLLRVVHHLSNFLNFDPNNIRYEFEIGKQKQLHIHCIINKLKKLDSNEIGKVHAKFKTRPIVYNEVQQFEEGSDKPCLIQYKINPKEYTWHLVPIENAGHYENLQEYIVKDQINFID